jgi:hypothetical protein
MHNDSEQVISNAFLTRMSKKLGVHKYLRYYFHILTSYTYKHTYNTYIYTYISTYFGAYIFAYVKILRSIHTQVS